MSFPTDENGCYRIPAMPGETRVVMDCNCGYGIDCPERVWDHISGQHAAAHQKGRDGLPAAAEWDVHHVAAGEPSPGRAVRRSGPTRGAAREDKLAGKGTAATEIAGRRGQGERGRPGHEAARVIGRDARDRGRSQLG